MSTGLSGTDKAKLIVAGLKRAGIDLITMLPDAWLTELLSTIDAEPTMMLIRVAREEEGAGICAGAFLGGRKGALIAQNAGILLAANALAGLAMHHQIPFLVLAAQRGGADDDQYYQVYKGRVTIPVLDALGLPYHAVTGPDDYGLIEQTSRQAFLARRPAVLLFTRRALLGEGR
jgi:sulfopyruvate decarboxylase subunit alpha